MKTGRERQDEMRRRITCGRSAANKAQTYDDGMTRRSSGKGSPESQAERPSGRWTAACQSRRSSQKLVPPSLRKGKSTECVSDGGSKTWCLDASSTGGNVCWREQCGQQCRTANNCRRKHLLGRNGPHVLCRRSSEANTGTLLQRCAEWRADLLQQHFSQKIKCHTPLAKILHRSLAPVSASRCSMEARMTCRRYLLAIASKPINAAATPATMSTAPVRVRTGVRSVVSYIGKQRGHAGCRGAGPRSAPRGGACRRQSTLRTTPQHSQSGGEEGAQQKRRRRRTYACVPRTVRVKRVDERLLNTIQGDIQER